MNLQNTSYDGELQMFTEPSREPNLARRRFLRWLGEQGRLEHPIAGAPAGLYALEMAIEYREVEHGRNALVSA